MRNLQNIGNQIAKSQYVNVEISNTAGLESIMTDVAVEGVALDNESAMHADLGNVIASLENIAEQAAASINDGGLDRQAAGILEVAVESHLNRVGLSASDAMVSIESFGGSSTQLEATQVSVEAIKDKAKELWAYLVKKFKEARQKIFAWFKKIFSGAAMLKKRAEGLAKTAVEKKGTKKDDVEAIELGAYGKALMGTDGTFKVSELAAGVKTFSTAATNLYGNNAKRVTDFAADVASIMDGVAKASKEDLEGTEVVKFVSGTKVMGKEVLKQLKGDYSSDTFLGGKVFVHGTPIAASDVTSLKSALDKATDEFTFENDEAPKFKEDQTFDALKPGEVKDIAENVVALAEEIISFESDYFKHAKNLEAADKAAEGLAKALDKVSLGSAGKAADKICAALYSTAQRANNQPVNGFTSSALASAKAALDVCDKSLGQFD